MTLEPEKDVYSLIKHDLANIYGCGLEAAQTAGYRDHWIEGYEDVMESFVGDLEVVIDNLDVGRYERPDLDSDVLGNLLNYNPDNFHEEFEDYVEKANELAGLAKDCVDNFERSEDYEKGWVKVSDIFSAFDGEVRFNGNGGDVVRGDGSLACVVNTLEDNAYRHGGDDVDTYAAVNPGRFDEFHDYLASVEGSNYGESEDRWVEADTERDYKILIWDDGEGLSDEFEDVEQIFSRGTGKNSGLGLPLSREIVEWYDGEMQAHNDHLEVPIDSGLIVSITLPGKKINSGTD